MGSWSTGGSKPLPVGATDDPAAATSALRAPPVDLEALPRWQQAAWRAAPLNRALFRQLLALDADREFLLGVVHNGLLLVPAVEQLQPFALPNYPSAAAEAARVQQVLAEEVQQGWVLPVAAPPRFVHPLGVVPKSSGGIRVIHNHSAPVGSSVNDQEVYVRYSWDTLEMAMPFFVPHVYMAKLDISAYYRHFMVHPSQWEVQGFEFGGCYYVDSRLQFGLRMAPEAAHRFTTCIKRVLHANGVQATVGVMDDYLFFHCSYLVCLVCLAVAVALLLDLGFVVNMGPTKTVLPSRSQKFVGVVLNSARMTLSLPGDKLQGLLQDVRAVLKEHTVRAHDLQALVGKMQWASKVVYGGRVFQRSLIDGIAQVQHPGQHVTVDAAMRADLQWWLSYAAAHNGVLSMAPGGRTYFVHTDACLSPVPSIGIFADGAFLSLAVPQLQGLGLQLPPADADINIWECFALLVAVWLLGDYWAKRRLLVFCDNSSTVSWVGAGAPRPVAAQAMVQQLFGLCVQQQIRLSVQHVPGEENVLADALSRQDWQRFGLTACEALHVDSPFLSTVLPALQASP